MDSFKQYRKPWYVRRDEYPVNNKNAIATESKYALRPNDAARLANFEKKLRKNNKPIAEKCKRMRQELKTPKTSSITPSTIKSKIPEEFTHRPAKPEPFINEIQMKVQDDTHYQKMFEHVDIQAQQTNEELFEKLNQEMNAFTKRSSPNQSSTRSNSPSTLEYVTRRTKKKKSRWNTRPNQAGTNNHNRAEDVRRRWQNDAIIPQYTQTYTNMNKSQYMVQPPPMNPMINTSHHPMNASQHWANFISNQCSQVYNNFGSNGDNTIPVSMGSQQPYESIVGTQMQNAAPVPQWKRALDKHFLELQKSQKAGYQQYFNNHVVNLRYAQTFSHAGHVATTQNQPVFQTMQKKNNSVFMNPYHS